MNTSVLTLALASLALAPTWQTSYTQAQQDAVAAKKPLAVFFGSGSDGWTKVIRDTKPPTEVSKVLSDQYVYVFVDTSKPEGMKVARSFEISSGLGMVISDRAGTVQAFWHQGDMTNDTMLRYLQKYADPNVRTQTTETVATARVSYYPSTGTGNGYYPSTGYAPSSFSGGRANC